MQKIKEQLILAKDDYDIIMNYLKNRSQRNRFDRQEAEELEMELRKAKVVNKNNLPEDVVRLNSRVLIKEEKEDRILEIMVVTPAKADIRQKKISVMSPIGTALIGFRKGQKVSWKVPSGKKIFNILEVINPFQPA